MKVIARSAQEPAVVTPDGAERRVLSYGGTLMLVQFTFAAGVTSWLHSHPQEQVGYVVSGEIDYLALIRAETPARLDELLDRIGALPGVARTTTSVVLARRIDRG